MQKTEESKAMNKTTERPPKYKVAFDVVGVIGGVVGIVGGMLGIIGHCHSLKVEDRQERRLCISDLNGFPNSLNLSAQDMTDALLKWAATPDLSHRVAAKKSATIMQNQLQTIAGQLEKYNLSEPALTELAKSVRDVIGFIRSDDAENAPIDEYALALRKFLSESPFSKRCPN
jgi:hypothetical protein